eukprot:562545-Pelagomonas_calceolata.AAC.3
MLYRAAANRDITVWFNADVADDMPWEFKPTQQYVRVKAGQSTLAFFTAHNKRCAAFSCCDWRPSCFCSSALVGRCLTDQRWLAGEQQVPLRAIVLALFLAGSIFLLQLTCLRRQVDDEDLEEEEELEPAPPGSGIKLHGPGVMPPQAKHPQSAPAA